MNLQTHFLFHRMPGDQLPVLYKNYQPIFESGKRITTLLPKNATLIRILASACFSALALTLLRSSVLFLPVALAGVSFTGWTIYSHILRKDPLIEAFHTIMGGKEKFKQLPELDWSTSKKLVFENIKALNWNSLDKPVYQAKTADGRQVVIVKALNYKEQVPEQQKQQTQSILAFVEKLAPADSSELTGKVKTPAIETILQAFQGVNVDNARNASVDGYFNANPVKYEWRMESSISREMANEFLAQLASTPKTL